MYSNFDITMLFTQKLPGYVFNKKNLGQKVTTVFKRELSTLRCVIYHAIFIEVCFQQLPPSWGEITTVFVPKLADMWYVSYHATYTKLIGVCFNSFFPLA